MAYAYDWPALYRTDHVVNSLKEKPFCVALTGGIASGKTTVSNLFAQLGAPIIDADVIAHQLTQKNSTAYHQIVTHFGRMILNTDDTINRKKLRELVFENPSEKKWLENLLHPLIREKMKIEISHVTYPYCICVIPLLAESTGIDFIDRVLVIETPIEIQINRATARDQSSADMIKKIIHAQAKSDARLKMANDVLENKGDIDSLKKQVEQLHKRYLTNSLSC